MRQKLNFVLLLFAFSLLASGCSHVISNPCASGDEDCSALDDEGSVAHSYIDGGWEFEEWNYVAYFFDDMFDSVEYEPEVRTSYEIRWGKYLDLNKILPVSDSVHFNFQNSQSTRYVFSMDKDGSVPPILKVITFSANTECFVKAIEKDGRWYYPIDMEEIYPENLFTSLALYNSDSSVYTGKVRNVSVFDNDKVWPLDFDVNLVIAGKFMGTSDKATIEEVAEKIFTRMNQALNPGGIHVRNINILYAKDHPVVGKDFSEDEPFIISGMNSDEEPVDELGHWPGHEGEIILVLGYYIVDESVSPLGFSPKPGWIYYDGSEWGASHVTLATHYDAGKSKASSQVIGNVSIHELGHFFGLDHTTEYGGKEFDDLDDTPECPNIGEKGSYNRKCPDYKYIMYPNESEETYETFTPQQMDIIRMYLSTTPHK